MNRPVQLKIAYGMMKLAQKILLHHAKKVVQIKN